jgi:hypothetical protein
VGTDTSAARKYRIAHRCRQERRTFWALLQGERGF